MNKLPPWHPDTVLCEWGNVVGMTIRSSIEGAAVIGRTGSAKSTTTMKHLATAYLAAGYGALVCCIKQDAAREAIGWARAVGREKDVVLIRPDGPYTFNFLQWLSEKPGPAGSDMNVVSFLSEVSEVLSADAAKAEGGGDTKFFRDSLTLLLYSLVGLLRFANYGQTDKLPLDMRLMREALNTAPMSLREAADPDWQRASTCWALLKEADEATKGAPEEIRSDFEECRTYWRMDWPALSEKTRGIIAIMAAMLFRPLLVSPLRQMLCGKTTVTPEAALAGKILIIDTPVDGMNEVGRACNVIWKLAIQKAIRMRPPAPPGQYLRPVLLAIDECQEVLTPRDWIYQSVCRSSGGATLYATQTIDHFKLALGSEAATEALLSNLANKFFHANTGNTTEYASKIIGSRYVRVASTTGGGDRLNEHTSTSYAEQMRAFVEPIQFATLRTGGEIYSKMADCIVYRGGALFPHFDKRDERGEVPLLPYYVLTLIQDY